LCYFVQGPAAVAAYGERLQSPVGCGCGALLPTAADRLQSHHAGGRVWGHTEPLRLRLEGETGLKKGNKEFLNELMLLKFNLHINYIIPFDNHIVKLFIVVYHLRCTVILS